MAVRNYLAELWQLMPRGKAWRRREGSVQDQVLHAISDELSRVDERALAFMEETDPRTAIELLDEWERELDLPGDCGQKPETIEDRRAAIITRLVALARQDEAYFVNIALQLGLVIDITHQMPFEIGLNGMGDEIGGSQWRHVWNVAIFGYPSDSIRSSLECAFNKFKPAHTVALFVYAVNLALEGDEDNKLLELESGGNINLE